MAHFGTDRADPDETDPGGAVTAVQSGSILFTIPFASFDHISVW